MEMNSSGIAVLKNVFAQPFNSRLAPLTIGGHFDVSGILETWKRQREAISLERTGTDFRLKTLNL
jgi:hypothetical protein